MGSRRFDFNFIRFLRFAFLRTPIIILLTLSCFDGYSESRFKGGIDIPTQASFTQTSQDPSISKRSGFGLGFELRPHLRWRALSLGPTFGYRLLGQWASPSKTGGTNILGSAWNVGALLALSKGKFSLGAIYIPLGSYSMAKNTSGGSSQSYSSPSAYSIFLQYKRTPRKSWFLGYENYSWSKTTIGGSTATLTHSLKQNLFTLGWGLSI